MKRVLINNQQHQFQNLAKQGRKLKKLKDKMNRAYASIEKAKTDEECTKRHLRYFEAKLDYEAEIDFRRTPGLKVRKGKRTILEGKNAVLFLNKRKGSFNADTRSLI